MDWKRADWPGKSVDKSSLELAMKCSGQQRQGEAERGKEQLRQAEEKHSRVKQRHKNKDKEKENTMKDTEMKVRLTFTEEVLGMGNSDPNIHEEFIASKAPDAPSREEEVAALGVDEVIEKGKTIFPKEDGKAFVWDYQIKGMFKDACGMLRYISDSKSKKLTSYKKKIDGLIFINERKIFYKDADGNDITEFDSCQRPLRAQTMQGERVTLANSETIPEGSYIEFTVQTLDASLMPAIKEWLDYGKLRGFGQWRNSGKGKFTWKEIA